MVRHQLKNLQMYSSIVSNSSLVYVQGSGLVCAACNRQSIVGMRSSKSSSFATHVKIEKSYNKPIQQKIEKERCMQDAKGN